MAFNAVSPALAAPFAGPGGPTDLAAVNLVEATAGPSALASPNVIATVGSGGTYPTLKAAFDDINGGLLTGTVQLDIVGSTVETATASLNASGTLSASYTSVLIQPTVSPVTITGSIVGAVIKLAGADNVTIDGRIGGTGRHLAVVNTSAAAATAAIWLTSLGAGAGATNNVIRNLEIAGGATQNTSSNSTFGIILASNNTLLSTSSNSDDNDNNSFLANRIIRVRYGIVTRGTTTNLTQGIVVADNLIGPAGFGPDEIGKVGIFMQADTGALVTRNMVQFVGGDFANTSGGADRVGIGIGQESWSMSPSTLTSNNYTVTANIIHDVIEERTFSAVGLLLATTGGGAATNNLVANNIIYNVKSNGTGGDQTAGLGIAGGMTDTVVFNSIALVGDVDPNPSASATTNFGSGIRIANASGASHGHLTLSNNSVYLDLSSSSAAAVRYYAISGNAASYSFGSGGENNNNYYLNPANPQLQTGGLGTVSGVTLAAQFATLANWQTAYTVAQDAASIQSNPNHAAVPNDLHLIGSSPNIDAGVNLAAVSTDIDGDVRPNGATADIGADEFYPLPGNLRFNTATYLTNEGDTVTVTVQRVGGSSGAVTVDYATSDNTATSGVCGVGDYVPATGTLTFGDLVTAQAFSVTLCPDAVLDPMETFTLTLSNPTGGAGLAVPSVAVVTIRDVPPPFNGTYTVGAGGTYPSLTNPGGFFEALNLGGASGPVTINIISDLPGESGTIALNEIVGGHPVLLKPSGAARAIIGTGTNNTVLKLHGADYVTIDGSLSGGTDRSLSIINPNPANGTLAVWVGSLGAGAGATNNTIKNTIIQAGTVGSTSAVAVFGIFVGSTTGAAAGADNDNLTIQNNEIRRASYGIQAVGGAGAGQHNDNLVIIGNLIGDPLVLTNSIRTYGILVLTATNSTISGNSIANVVITDTGNPFGIALGTSVLSSSVMGNAISNIRYTGTGGYGGKGIDLNTGATASNLTIANNMVSDIKGDGWNSFTGDSIVGIRVGGTTGGVRLYHNSVNLGSGPFAGNSTGTQSAALYFAAGTSGLDVRNNILSTNLVNTNAVAAKTYAIATGATTNTIFTTIDHNLYYTSDTQALVGFLSTDRATLADWQTASGQDANSLLADPVYVAPTDLHLQATSPAINAGTPVPVSIDIDGEPRLGLPDIGADELMEPISVTVVYHDLEDAVALADTLYVDGLPSFGSPVMMTGDLLGEVFTATVMLTSNATYQFKFVVNTLDAYGYDLLNNPNVNRVFTVTTNTLHSYRRIWQYDYFALLGPAAASSYLGDPSPVISGETFITNLTAPAGVVPGLRAQVGYGTDLDPANWMWSDIPFNAAAVSGANNDGFSGTFTPAAVGVYSYAVRFNANWGVGNPNSSWVYGGLGFAPLAPDLSNAGVITVNSPLANIVVTKTVGLPGAGCAGSDWLTVAPNTEVEYCFTVQNTGQVTFTMHTVTDTVLGTVLSNFAYTLMPGASTFVTGSYTHTTAGLHPNTVTWEATDGATTVWVTDTANVLVNLPPTANAGNDQTVYAGSTVMLDGSASSDSDNNLPLTYEWAQTGGPAVMLSDATVVSPTFTAPANATVLTFTLMVTDSLGAPSPLDEVVITVDPAADLQISKTDALDPAPLGQPLTYTLWLTNAGPSLALQAWVTDTLPNGLNFVSAPGCTEAVGVVTCNLNFFESNVRGTNEVPPNSSSGTGRFVFFYDFATKVLRYQGAVTGLGSNVTAAHIHQGLVGANGGVVFPLGFVTSTNAATFQGSVTLSLAQEATLLAEGFYVNVHTTGFAGGEVRDQIWPGLAAGATASLNVVVMPTQPGWYTNTAEIASPAFDPNLSNNTAWETTQVNATYGVTLAPATAGQSAAPGSLVTYTLWLTNTGTYTDTFDLGLSANAWATMVNPTMTAPLAAGAGTLVQVQVTIPATATANATDMVHVLATSQGDNGQTAMAMLTTTVGQTYGVSLTPASAGQSANPGTTLTYTLRVTNTGNVNDTFNLNLTGHTWPTTVTPTSTGVLAAGTGTNVLVQVTIPTTATANATNVLNVTAVSQGNGAVTASATLTTTTNQVYGVSASPATQAQMGYVGRMVTYTVMLTNTGNGSDSFNLSILAAAWGTTATPTTTVALAAGASTTVQIVVSVPLTATHGATDTATIRATSLGNDSSVLVNVTVTTTAVWYRLSLPYINR